jgi:hypothetical protein
MWHDLRFRRHDPAQDLRGLPAQAGGVDIEGRGALFLALAVGQHGAAMPAEAERHWADFGADLGAAISLAEGCEVDDVLRCGYAILNHAALLQWRAILSENRYSFSRAVRMGQTLAEKIGGSVQPNAQILGEEFAPT